MNYVQIQKHSNPQFEIAKFARIGYKLKCRKVGFYVGTPIYNNLRFNI
jgi:hypothetical protein